MKVFVSVCVATVLSSSSRWTTVDGMVTTPDATPSTFPLARRALIEKARSIDSSIANGGKSGTYSSVGWSNRLGTVLTPASVPGVYTADRPFMWNNIDVGCRMTVIELQSSASTTNNNNHEKPDLFVHSPVFLDGPLIAALAALGTVKHVVSPNYEHVKFAQMWGVTYPEANMWACPGMMEKEPQVRWTGELPVGCRPPGYDKYAASKSKEQQQQQRTEKSPTSMSEDMWNWDEIQPTHIDCERIPVLNTPFFSEVIFYHKPSKTLMTTDLFWNYPSRDGVTNNQLRNLPIGTARKTSPDSQEEEIDYGVWELAPEVGKIPRGSTLWKFGMDKVYRPIYLNILLEKEAFRNIAEYICNDLDVNAVIPAHGDIVRGKTFVRNVLRKHLALD